MADSKISALTDGGGLKAGDALAVARAAASFRVSPIGVPVLVYRYTVTGSDKASIDTGVDTADAGSNDWTNGDVLEIFLLLRSDDAGATGGTPNMTVNNDTGSNYDRVSLSGAGGGSPGMGTGLAQTSWPLVDHGSGGSASYAAPVKIVIPDYAGTTLFKSGELTAHRLDATTGNNAVVLTAIGWRSTSAITRLAISAGGSAKFKVGSQLLIYKRLSS